jgi:hypothetical protein
MVMASRRMQVSPQCCRLAVQPSGSQATIAPAGPALPLRGAT